MRLPLVLVLLPIVLLLCSGQNAYAEVEIPPLRTRVTDRADTLSSSERQILEEALAKLEREKGAQVAVLLVPSTRPETIEAFSFRVASAWRLGRAGVDDGVLLVVAKDDRTVRIEVGYGLEGAIPDAAAKRIIDEYIIPSFRSGDFFGGILNGVNRIAQLVRGEPLPAPRSSDSWWSTSFAVMFFIGELSARFIGRGLAALLSGVVVGTILGWFMSPAVGVIFGLVIASIIFLNGVRYRTGYYTRNDKDGLFIGGGGFSGGGGSFGGGGASGRW